MYKLLIVFFCFFLACNNKIKEVDISLLPKIIQSFANHLNRSGEFKDAIVVNLSGTNKIWELELINTFPDSTSRVNRDTIIDGVRVFFTGEKIMKYSVKNFPGDIPLDVMEASRKRLFWGQESIYWLLKFEKGKFTYLDPSDIICEEVPEICKTKKDNN